jgi:CelD/BcsL family acetyltransferase involved in cellulose biosynthesis
MNQEPSHGLVQQRSGHRQIKTTFGYASHMIRNRGAVRWQRVPADRFAQVTGEWQRLASRFDIAPFLQSDFIEPALSHFANGNEQIAIAESSRGVVGMVILAPPSRGRAITFQPSQLPLGPVLLGPELPVEDAIVSALDALPLTTLALGFTQLDSALYPRPASADATIASDYVRTAWIDVAGSFADYWDSRGKNLRHNMRKQRRKLADDGIEARLEILRGQHEVADAIADYGRLESAGWKAAGGTSVHPDNAQGRFYREMLQRFCARDRGCVYRYRFGDKVVAVDLCIESETTLVILKTTYDESVQGLSPAFLMREEAFQRIWDEGRIKRIEFYGKLMDWHKRWTDNSRDIFHLTRFRWRWLAAARSAKDRVDPHSPT